MKGSIIVSEVDGHNDPIYHLFRDIEQATKYINVRGGPELTVEKFEDELEYEDDNYVVWRVTTLPGIDLNHTEED